MLKTITAIAAVVVAGAFVVPTVSQAAESNSVRVSYADLNLASGAGQSKLRGRIYEAARAVCEYEDSQLLEVSVPTTSCRIDAVERAQPAFQAAVAAARHGTVTVLESAAIIVSAD